MARDPGQPFPRVTVPDDVAKSLAYFACFAASHESLKPAPVSRVHGPDGGTQPETQQEFVTRVVTAGVLHLIEIGLLTVPDDLAARLDDYLPMSRES
jgi:hypothetical protein